MTGYGQVGVQKQTVEGNDPHTGHGRVPARGLCVGHYPPQPVSVLRPAPTLSPSFLMAQAIFEPNLFPYYTPIFLKPSSFYTHLPPVKMEQSVPKRRHINFRRRGTTQKKTYSTQNMAEV